MIMRKTKDKSMNVSEDEFVEICISVIKGLLNLKMEREGDINTPWSHMSKDERYRNFLREYEKLCKKYGVFIDACGCCNSPWMVLAKDELDIDLHIEHLIREYEK